MICKYFLTLCRLSFCFFVFLDAQKFSVLMKFKFSTFAFVTVLLVLYFDTLGFPGGSVVKNSPVNAGDAGDQGSIPGLGRFSGEEHGNPLPYSCLENPIGRRI